MTLQMRNDLTPQGYIRHMFDETKNGKFTVEYENPYITSTEKEERTLELSWTAEDVETIEDKYNMLTFALARIGRLHDELIDEESAKKLLSEDDFEVWNTYVRPYDEFEEDLSVIAAIEARAIGDLFEEEEEILEKYYKWIEEQSQKRIPFNRRSSADLINSAARYERLISLNAPEIVITEEGRWLAEEIALYYFGKEEPIIWD